MNFPDIFLAVILLAGIIRGFMKGFVYELAVFAALFLGVYIAFKCSHLLTPWLSKVGHFSSSTVGMTSSFLLFIAVVVGMVFLAKLFTGLIDMVALGIFNKILGAMFGLAKHALILSVLIYFFNQLDNKHHFISPDTKAASKIYYPLMKVAPALFPVMRELKIELTGDKK
jgi:membrane protein required for colicin V production